MVGKCVFNVVHVAIATLQAIIVGVATTYRVVQQSFKGVAFSDLSLDH